MNTFRTIGQYEISDMCLQTFPCQHYVKKNNGSTTRMFGSDIYCMLLNEEIHDEHFDMYIQYIQKRDHPTQEDLAEREKQRLERQKEKEKSDLEEAQRQAIIDENRRLGAKYSSSSRISRLRSAHNAI